MPGVEERDHSYDFSKDQIEDFCNQESKVIKTFDEHSHERKIGETIISFNQNGVFPVEMRIDDQESIEKLLSGVVPHMKKNSKKSPVKKN